MRVLLSAGSCRPGSAPSDESAHAAALMSLKRKKMIESQLEQVENNLQRILEQQTMLEDQRLNMEALLAQQYAAKASKASMQVRLGLGSLIKDSSSSRGQHS